MLNKHWYFDNKCGYENFKTLRNKHESRPNPHEVQLTNESIDQVNTYQTIRDAEIAVF